MPSPLTPESTTFTIDALGRYICNGLDEARQSVSNGGRPFDVIVVGGGSFGAVVAERVLFADATRSHRVLVLEAGPFAIPEHVQNLPTMADPPVWGNAWHTFLVGGFRGLAYCVGGRSIFWGGWSPQLLDAQNDTEMRRDRWPNALVTDLTKLPNGYFKDASAQIGVDETNDFLYGPLQNALRQQIFDAITSGNVRNAMDPSALPDHPAVRFSAQPPSDNDLVNWLGLPLGGPVPKRQLLLDLLKLEAPLAVQSQTDPGQFPFNKFSTVPLLTAAARTAGVESDFDDSRKRLMIVPNCHVTALTTVNEGGTLRVTGVQVSGQPEIPVGRDAVVVLALGTIENARLALISFGQSGVPSAAQMGKNLMAHMRSNLTIRVRRDSLTSLPANIPALQVGALFVKGKAIIGGRPRYFHLQITASGLGPTGTNSEAELFRKVPDLEHVVAMREADDSHVVVTIRGIGEMEPDNPESAVYLSTTQQDFGQPKAFVALADPRDVPPAAASQQTKNDHDFWEAMDTAIDDVAIAVAGGKELTILIPPQGEVTETVKLPAGATANDVAAAFSHRARRDGMGTTHHEAGTLRMGTVTNDVGRFNDVANAYVAGPALFPTVGSPNPMLTGVAVARRTADHLLSTLPHPVAPALPSTSGATRKYLFDGTSKTFDRWRRIGGGTTFTLIDGQIVTLGQGDFSLLYYTPETFENFVLRLKFMVSNVNDNSGVFVRFRDPLLRPTPDILTRDTFQNIPANKAWIAVYSGFEVQIDDQARGDSRIGEANGLNKNRTGAIYKISAGDGAEPKTQEYVRGPILQPWQWYQYEIAVQHNEYTVKLAPERGTLVQTTRFKNLDAGRGIPPTQDPTYGYIGWQSYSGSRVAFREISIETQ
jgi:choline dehydrogenase-like flavoprotein